MLTIGEKVSEYCNRNMISHFEFATMAGMTSVSIGRLTTNNLPNVLYLVNIARVLGENFGDMMKEHYETLAERIDS